MPPSDFSQEPRACWTGAVTLIETPADCDAALLRLRGVRVVGLDTETKPTFFKGQPPRKPALMQLAAKTKDGIEVFLIFLKPCGLTPALLAFLQDPAVSKTGAGIHDDMKGLVRIAPFKPAGMLELGALAKRKGIHASGLRSLAGTLYGERVSKRIARSNWGRAVLSEAQIRYAATDAWLSLRIYETLCAMPDAETSAER